jgi:hypothetical protein
MNNKFLEALGISPETAQIIMEEYSKELNKRDKQAEIEAVFDSFYEQWVNAETREFYYNKLITEIEKQENNDLSVRELLDSLLADENGKYREGIFKVKNTNPNRLEFLFPSQGKADMQSINNILGGR